MLAHEILEGTIGHRSGLRLRENESYEELVLLGKCDRAGRQRGILTSRLEEVLDYLRDLSLTFGE